MRSAVTLLVLLASIAAGHAAVLFLAPGFIMGRAMTAMEQRGMAPHGFRLVDRMTPQTQTVVRPSPDLAYSVCLFDFEASKGHALGIRAAPWSDYSSVSFFDAKTNNFATLRGGGNGVDAVLLPPGAIEQADALISPSEKGVILIRRLAPTEAAYREVAAIAVGDRCQMLRLVGEGE